MSNGEILTGNVQSAGRADKVLAQASSLSRERVKALMAEGAVVIDGKEIKSPKFKLGEGTRYQITVPPPEDPVAQPEDIPLNIVFEDEHLIVVDKAAGMVVHPGAGNWDGTLVNALLFHCGQSENGGLSGIGGVARPGIVHRIDKDTSGLLVVAKSDAAHLGLAKQFADHSLERAYLAICNGHPSPPFGKINARLGRSDHNRKKMAILPDDSTRGKHAITHFRTEKQLDCATLIECRLETGRTHQVRVHLGSIGHALLGDPVYGSNNSKIRPVLKRLGFARQALHAAILGFIHPVNGNQLRFSSELPSDMRELIDELGYSNR